jgi:hypothetical protein
MNDNRESTVRIFPRKLFESPYKGFEKDLQKKCFYCGNKWYYDYYPLTHANLPHETYVCKNKGCRTLVNLICAGELVEMQVRWGEHAKRI